MLLTAALVLLTVTCKEHSWRSQCSLVLVFFGLTVAVTLAAFAVDVEEAGRARRLADHLPVPTPPTHHVHLPFLVVELAAEHGRVLPALGRL